MDIGMLWFDDGPLSLSDKIDRAVAFYAEKYGRAPTHCLVNPATLNGGEATMAGVEVRKARSVMPDHFWIGVEDKGQLSKPVRRKAA